MTPVWMQFSGAEHPSGCGDCLRACFASLFDLPADQVPHFGRDEKLGPVNGLPRWELLLVDWLRAMGFSLMIVTISGPEKHWPAHSVNFHHVRIGKTPGEGPHHHAAVFRGHELIHDPAPSNEVPFLADYYPQTYLIVVKG